MLGAALLLTGCKTAQNGTGAEVPAPIRSAEYIPENLEDCFVQLKQLLKPEDVQQLKAGTEKDMGKYHFGLGMNLRNGWGLWRGSRLAKWFNDQGVSHPDDMSGIILVSFWRHLNGKPINLEQQVKHYQDFWKDRKATQSSSGGDSP